VLQVIYPFLPFLVGWYLPDLEPHQLGFRAGYLGSAFNLGSIFAGFFWGRLADSIGRRPVFLVCIGGLATLLFAFAFAPTFWSAVIIRGIAGTFMGIPPLARTYLADITDETNMATGFSLIGVVRGCVLVVGPALGGFLVHPAENFGGPFDNFVFRAYPFCLPILVRNRNLSRLCFRLF
jgi:MFS family permease